MLKERHELEEELIPELQTLVGKKRSINKVVKELSEYDVLEGNVRKFFNNPEEVKETDTGLLYLLSNSVYKITKNENINPEEYYTESEIKEAKQYSGKLELNLTETSLPLTLENSTLVGTSTYMTTMSIQDIDSLRKSGVLNYNFETQRESKFERRHGEIIQVATLNQKSVDEISRHLEEGTLVPTVLVFNAAVRTSDTGDELIYDSKKHELTITKGTRLDILDGYHRTMGIKNALSKNPNIDFRFPVMFVNYSVPRAQQYLGQIAKANPISKARAEELSKTNLSSVVIQELRDRSELKGRISQTERIHTLNRELVSYSVLANAIDEEFNMKSKADAMDVADYLVEFFDYLLGSFRKEFIDEIEETRKVSYINHNFMFAGYVVLARRLFESNQRVTKIKNILSNIDFNKNNKLWEELGLISDGKFNYNRSNKIIKDYFKHLEI